MHFKIESLYNAGAHNYVLVSQVGSGNFTLLDDSFLGGVAILSWVDRPRKLKSDGSLDLSAYVFCFKPGVDYSVLSVGDLVELY
jgi:hypothetical protein